MSSCSSRPPWRLFLAAATVTVAAAGCGSGDADGPGRARDAGGSVLAPASDAADAVADLGWVMLITSSVVTLGVFALLGFGLARRRRREDASDRGAERWVIAGGVILPVVVLIPIAGLGVAALGEEEGAALRVEVIGHQYWWEYRYPDLGVVTANELHIPVGEPVDLRLHSDDVIHSLWVPDLGGKTDLVPGHTTTMTLEAERAGTYQGKCAEYCGLQHAKMLFLVVAEDGADFDRWVEQQQDDADPAPATEEGQELFARNSCAACHTVRGTDADGRLGPDLTHIASRRTLAAGVLDNTPENLRRWIDETWEVKDGITMPPVPLSDDEVEAIAAYLETLE